MNKSNRKPIASIALAAFVLITSACSGSESKSAAVQPGRVDTQVQGINEEAPDEAEESPIEAQVQGITEAASIAPDDVDDIDDVDEIEEAPTEQRFEMVGVPRGLNLRSGPGVSFELIEGIEKDRILTGTGTEQDGWTEVTIDGTTGWVSSQFLQPTDAPDNSVEDESTADPVFEEPAVEEPAVSESAANELIVVNVPAGLNLRAGPDTSFEIVGGAILGASVTATGQRANEWVEVAHDGVVGWASENYLAPG